MIAFCARLDARANLSAVLGVCCAGDSPAYSALSNVRNHTRMAREFSGFFLLPDERAAGC